MFQLCLLQTVNFSFYIVVSVIFLKENPANKRVIFCFFFVYVEFRITLKLFFSWKKQWNVITSSLITFIKDDYFALYFQLEVVLLDQDTENSQKLTHSFRCFYGFYFCLSFTIIMQDLKSCSSRAPFLRESDKWYHWYCYYYKASGTIFSYFSKK